MHDEGPTIASEKRENLSGTHAGLASRGIPCREVTGRRFLCERDAGLQQRRFHFLSSAGSASRVQRRKDTVAGVQASHVIGREIPIGWGFDRSVSKESNPLRAWPIVS